MSGQASRAQAELGRAQTGGRQDPDRQAPAGGGQAEAGTGRSPAGPAPAQAERVPTETPCGDVSAREASYLLTLFELGRGEKPPTQAALARAMEVSPPTALEMVRRLRHLGLLCEDSLELTDQGRSAALVLASRRHAAHVLAHDLLGITDERQADLEAERLAPNVSPRLTRRLIADAAARRRG